ncbi:hypothetical protein Moror_733 [Moniliophthora roreri MCA 2997]|uniref:FBD domain-containing protein n=1 Tax=Moniliophthora roreri (strain MCA 2997) TaxID=1381753 RepID=V2WSY1_MONRO|nr:hypothetical protein Moror_733 [Moniliophthora roreri MCA 2997]
MNSSPRIHTFQVNRFPLEDHHLLLILEKMPNLLKLDITEAGWMWNSAPNGKNRTVTVRFLQDLTRARVLPHLKDIRLVVHNDWAGNDRVFEEMLESRSRWASLLRSAYLKVVDEAGVNLDLTRLRRLQEEGLAVRVARGFNFDADEVVEVLGYRKDI